jgi:hypothetical protein
MSATTFEKSFRNLDVCEGLFLNELSRSDSGNFGGSGELRARLVEREGRQKDR